MATDKPLHQVSRPGLVLKVFGNRVEVEDGFLFLKSNTTIFFKNIASVQFEPAVERLMIETTGGKKYKYLLSGMGNRAKAAADAIKQNM